MQFFQRVRFWNKNFKTRQILNKKFYEASDFGLKNYNALDFELKNSGHVIFAKRGFHPKNHVLFHFTPWKRHISHFWCFFKSMILKWNFWKRVTFQFKGSTTRQIWDWKKTFSKSYWTCHVFLLKKHNTSEFQLKIIQPLRDQLTSGSFQLYIWWINLQQTLSFNFLP